MKTIQTNKKLNNYAHHLCLTLSAALAIGAISMPLSCLAQSSAKEGLERIGTNLTNTKANLDEYKKNLQTVDGNIAEVAKAKSKVIEQQKSVNVQVDSTSKSINKIDLQEKELNQLATDEKSKLAQEDKKIAEMEALIAKIHENRKKREANIADYQLQTSQLLEEKKIWQSRAQALKEQSQDVNQKVKSVASEEAQWKNKQKGYQGEISRWTKEVEKQQKIHDSYSTLAEGH